ncbi:hypothetical protein G6010_12545 [Dietzia sp. SLG510A3-3B2-2]|nr:hypothetical protein [Dietzia sp. SLG510A3-40A3]MBB1010316.1 hypothetical protein [Dietzia sp. SLG510A3-3B2-2]
MKEVKILMRYWGTCPACDEPVEIMVPRVVDSTIECAICGATFEVKYGPVDKLAEAFRDDE